MEHAGRDDRPADDLLDDLARWAAEARVDEAAAARSRQRWLEQAAAEEGAWLGVLLDLAERGAPVVVTTGGGRRHRGRLAAVATDFVVVRPTAGPDVLVALKAVASVRPHGAEAMATGDRVVSPDLTLAVALNGLAADRPRVRLVVGSEAMSGELLSAGRDVLTLHLDGRPRSAIYVPVESVSEVSRTASG